MSTQDTKTNRRVGRAIAGVVAVSAGLLVIAHFSQTQSTLLADEPTTQPFGGAVPPRAAKPLGPELPIADSKIGQWFSELASLDAAVRSEAFTKLMGLDADDLPTLKKIVAEHRPLAPAQTAVLHQIVAQVYLSGLRYKRGVTHDGFLGVTMGEARVKFHDADAEEVPLDTVGIVITDRVPGFAGARMLRDGDVILSILDRPDVHLTTFEVFRLLVRSFGAGATIHFEVLRDGQVIQVPVTLDPRPMEADYGIDAIREVKERRAKQADEYWNQEFAGLVDGAF